MEEISENKADNGGFAPLARLALITAFSATLIMATPDEAFAQKKHKKVKQEDLPEMLRTGSIEDAKKRQKELRKLSRSAPGNCAQPVPPPIIFPEKKQEFTHEINKVVTPPPVVTPPKKRKSLRNH